MKKTILMMLLSMLSFFAFGAEDDALLEFSTPGPDRYLDGSCVLDGEVYALVWTSNTCAFAGFKSDGQLISKNDKLIAAAPLAKDGRCPTCLFQISKAVASELNKTGTFQMYLLDTRDLATGKLSKHENGHPTIVNAFSYALTDSCVPGSIGSANAANLAGFADDGIVIKDYVVDFEYAANPIIITQTNVVEIAHTNEFYHDVFVDVFVTNMVSEVMTNYIDITRIQTQTEVVYNYLTITNDVNVYEKIPMLSKKAICSYVGIAKVNGKEIGTLELKMYKPNQYGYARILMRNFILHGTKRKRSAIAYGMVIDEKWMYANFKKNTGWIEFSGIYAVGEYVLDGIRFHIDLQFVK